MTENEAFRRAWRENAGLPLQLSTIARSPKIHRILFFITATLILPPVLGPVFVSEDVNLRLEMLHWFTILIQAYIVAIERTFREDTHRKIFETIADRFHDYGATLDPVTERKVNQIKNESNYWKNKIGKAFSGAITVAATVLALLRALFIIYNGSFAQPQDEDGILYSIPLRFWVPFRDPYGIACYTISIIINYIIFTILFIVMAQDVTMICFGHEARSEMEILACTLENLESRAVHLHTVKHGVRPKSVSDPKFTECIRLCFIQSVQHHQVIIKFVGYLHEISYFVVFMIIFGATGLLSCAAIMFVIEGVSFEVKSMFVVFGMAECLHTFVHAFYGQKIFDGHYYIRNGLYEFNWWKYSKTIKSDWLIVNFRCQRPLHLSAGGFFYVDLQAFSFVMRSTYSLFNLMNASHLNSS